MRLGAKIKECFEASRRAYGSPRLAVVLRRVGETGGRHRAARLMRVLRLRPTQKRRFRPRTTDSRHLCPIAPNHLAERPPPSRPGQVWQADTQQYLCKACGAHRVLAAKSPAIDPERKAMILRAVEVERLSLRAAERIFGVARQTIAKWLKKKRKVCRP